MRKHGSQRTFTRLPEACSRRRSTMMPVSLLIALLIAFGIEPPATGVPQADVVTRVLETFGGITLIASLAFGLGFWVAFRASHIGSATVAAPPALRARRSADHLPVAGGLRLDHPLGRLVQAGPDQLGPGWIDSASTTSSFSCLSC